MPREIPDVPKDWKKPTVDGGRSYDIELITPMFGGGVETRVNDPSFPIRPTAIRGQLQFWWRATVGAQYEKLDDLRKAQSALWGDTTQASRVQVRVDMIGEPSEPKVCAVIKPNRKGKDQVFWEPPFRDNALPYALFPFQGKPANPKVEPASCIHKAAFRLTVITHRDIDFAKQVEPALWAWVNFGGLGSRTRRGCGAILCKELAPRDHTHLAEQLKAFALQRSPVHEWPTIAELVLHGTVDPADDPIRVWNRLIRLFRCFRQGVGFARNPNPGQQANRPGRSRYPEPEAIRRVTGQRSSQHARLAHLPDDAFPRAELGLPIVFHFQGQGEPTPDPILYPSNSTDGKPPERMASPLILKPVALADGKAIPLILRLRTPPLSGVDLRRGDTSLPLPPSTVIRDSRLSTYPDSPLAGSPNGSALDAFLTFARAEGFTEVSR